MANTVTVLGVDAGLAACGYALVRFGDGRRDTLAAGVVVTAPDKDAHRLDDVVARGLHVAIEVGTACFTPLRLGMEVDVIAVEDVAHLPNRRAQHDCSCAVGMLAGYLICELSKLSTSPFRHPKVALLGPDEIKEIFGLGRRGHATDKSWVDRMFRPYHPGADGLLAHVKPADRNHAWDAVAAAEAAVLLRPEWFAECDPWRGIRKRSAGNRDCPRTGKRGRRAA